MPKTTTIDHTSVLRNGAGGLRNATEPDRSCHCRDPSRIGPGRKSPVHFHGDSQRRTEGDRQEAVQCSGQKTDGTRTKEALATAEGEEGPGKEDAAYGSCEAPEGRCGSIPQENGG